MLTEEPKATAHPGTARARPRARPLPQPLQPGVELPPDSLGYRLKNKLLGPPLHTEQLEHERLGKPTALAVFASDNLSSSAYATEEILRVLVPGHRPRPRSRSSCRSRSRCSSCSCFLILSYRQTIKAYPTAGGAYMVTRDNFGLLPAQVAGVALLTDYVLTVSVSVAAGTAALASAFPVFDAVDPADRRSRSCRHRVRQPARRARSRASSSRSRPTSSSSTWSCCSASASFKSFTAGSPQATTSDVDRHACTFGTHSGSGLLIGASLVARAPRVRVGRRRGHRRRGDLQRRARVPASRRGRTPARRS